MLDLVRVPCVVEHDEHSTVGQQAAEHEPSCLRRLGHVLGAYTQGLQEVLEHVGGVPRLDLRSGSLQVCKELSVREAVGQTMGDGGGEGCLADAGQTPIVQMATEDDASASATNRSTCSCSLSRPTRLGRAAGSWAGA